ncbi:peptidase [Flexivirga endophytica]|uniref:Peptidase n=1 Tax=Flexivirga endophytica TaxID=1849103 RepID=A0A916T401_9MICO|nr:alpha/beta hydrolase [Flexivirga endophytica]GGB30652.1 peptidase [Flexivirga endophytica]GHB51569.1 peptidase [Flexivirga endophytica]
MRRRLPRLVTVSALAVLVAASGEALATAPAHAAAESGSLSPTHANLDKYTSQHLTWSAALCPKEVRDLGKAAERSECAQVTAPKDYSHPDKGDLKLMVTRTKPEQSGKSDRVVFTNPGGPGGPAARFSAIVAAMSPLGRTETVVGVDPRGTGESTPVSCDPPKSKVRDNHHLTDANVKALQTAVKASVDKCVAQHGDYLPYINTDNTARDHDLVRQLLGVKKVDYYGVSAGTWLGAHYATLFPEHVGRFVLDSNTAFTKNFQASFGYQPMGFQRRFSEQFEPWAARHDDTYGIGSTTAEVEATHTRVRKAAAEGKLGFFSANVVDNVLAQQMYSDKGLVTAAKFLGFLDEAREGDKIALYQAFSLLSTGSDSYTDNRESTTFMATTCNDTSWKKDPDYYVGRARSLGPKYPLLGYGQVVNQCAYWPYKATNSEVDLSKLPEKAPKILMVDTTLDPATPYEGAVAAHKDSANTVLLTVNNQGNHGAVLGSKNKCVTDAAYGFLMNGALITKDSVCQGVPLPGDDKVYPTGKQVSGPKPSLDDSKKPAEKHESDSVGDTLLKILEKLIGDIFGGPHA